VQLLYVPKSQWLLTHQVTPDAAACPDLSAAATCLPACLEHSRELPLRDDARPFLQLCDSLESNGVPLLLPSQLLLPAMQCCCIATAAAAATGAAACGASFTRIPLLPIDAV
jgi:hypothetical protein